MPSVDEKVVKLSMDDSELDKGTKRAINDLDNLKKALEFKDAERGLEAVSQAAARVDMNPLSNGIANVSNQFNLLNTIATSAIFNVTNKAIDAGERLVKSLSVDQISAGWDKFADKTSAVQTIMAATSKEFSDTGEQMAYVSEQLDKLNWFTDETSYNFTDMVNNIGKFTSAGQKLDTSVDAMQGIATWAARSGAGVQGASRAMYNLSQAMAIGKVQLMDWRSIENANMSTLEFKETAMDTAVELGTLTKVAKGLYATLDGTTTTIEGMNYSLEKGWFTSDVLVKTLEKYGGFASELNKLYEELDRTVPTTSLLGFIDDYVAGTLDMQEAMTSTGMTAEELAGWLEKLGSKEYELGRQSLKAAQETKTFQEVIDATKDAVSTGWMTTFEMLFGNYEEAKEFFSNMSEWFYDLFVSSGEARNSLLRLWKDDGGRDKFIEGLYQVMDNISNFVEMLQSAWRSVFPQSTVNDLLAFTDGFINLIDSMTLTEESLNSIQKSLSGFFSIIKTGKDIVVGLWNATEPLRDALNRLGGSLVWVLGSFGEKIFNKRGTISDSRALNDLYSIIYKISTVIGDNLVNAFNALYTGAIISGRVISKIVDVLKNGELSVSQSVSAIGNVFDQLINGLTGGLLETSGYSGLINSSLSVLGNTIQNFINFIGNFLNVLTGAEGDTKKIVGTISSVLGGLAKGISNLFASITIDDVKTVAVIGSIVYLTTSLGTVFKSLSFFTDKFFSLTERLKKSTSLDSFITQLNAALDKTVLLQIGIAVTLLVNALSKIAAMDTNKLALSVVALVGISAGLLKVMREMGTASKDVKPGNIFKMGIAMTTLGAAFVVVSEAMSIIGKMDVSTILLSLGTMAAVMIGVEKFAEALNNVKIGKLSLFSTSLTLLAVGLTSMAVPIAIFGTLDIPQLLTGLGAVGALLAEVLIFSNALKNVDIKSLAGVSASLALLSVAVTNMSVSVSSLSALNFEQLLVGLTGIATILTTLSVSALVISKIDTKSLLSASASLIVLSASIGVIAGVVKSLSTIKLTDLMSAIAGLTTMSLGLVGILELLKLVTTGMGVGQMATISASLLSLTGAMIGLAAGLKMMEGVSWSTIAQGLVALGGGLAILLAAGAIAQYTGIGAGIATVVAALVGLSSIMLIVAGSIAIIVNSIKTLSDTIVALIASAALFGDELPNLVQTGIDALKVGFKGILSIVYESVPEMTLAITAVISAVTAAILAAKSSTVLAVVSIGLAILEALKQFGGPIMDALTYVVNMMTEKLPGLMLAIGDFIEQLFAGIGILVTKAIYGLFEGVLNLIPFVGQKLAADLHDESERVGEAYLDGFTKTVKDGQEDAYNASASVGNAAVNGLTSKNGIDSNSPSKRTQQAGRDFNDGFIDTIKSGQESAKQAGTDLGNSAAESTSDGIKDSLDDKKEETKNDILSWFNEVVGELDLGVDIPVNLKLFGGSSDKKEESVYVNPHLKETLERRKKWEEQQKQQAYDTGYDLGDSAASGIGSGLASSKAPAAAARSQAQNVGNAFTDEIKKLDLADKTANSLLSLWKAQNPNASEAEIAAKEMGLIADQIVTQSKRAEIAQIEYTDTLKTMGSTATETSEAYIKMIDEQTKLIELQNKLTDAQVQGHTSSAEAFQKMTDILHDYYYNENNGRTMADFLRSLGFTDQEIAESAAQEAGYAIPKMVEETKAATLEATETAGQQTVQLYAQSVTSNLESLLPEFQSMGNNYADTLGYGIVENTENVSQSALDVVNTTLANSESKDIIQKWNDVGYHFMTGMVAGIVRGSPEVEAAIAAAVARAIAAAKAAAGVASPSKETMWQAEMWMDGYVQGIKNNTKKVRDSLSDLVVGSLLDAEGLLGTGGVFGENTVSTMVDGMRVSVKEFVEQSKKALEIANDNFEEFVDKYNEKVNDDAIYEDLAHRIAMGDFGSIFRTIRYDGEMTPRLKSLLNRLARYAGIVIPGSSLEDRLHGNKMSQELQRQQLKMIDWQTRNQDKETTVEKDMSTVTNNNYTQNIYSPKAVSRMDIRRDTERILSITKKG